eukprot:2134782-Amphidinium_carterae.2
MMQVCQVFLPLQTKKKNRDISSLSGFRVHSRLFTFQKGWDLYTLTTAVFPRGIVHGDVRLDNFLVCSKDFIFKLTGVLLRNYDVTSFLSTLESKINAAR